MTQSSNWNNLDWSIISTFLQANYTIMSFTYISTTSGGGVTLIFSLTPSGRSSCTKTDTSGLGELQQRQHVYQWPTISLGFPPSLGISEFQFSPLLIINFLAESLHCTELHVGIIEGDVGHLGCQAADEDGGTLGQDLLLVQPVGHPVIQSTSLTGLCQPEDRAGKQRSQYRKLHLFSVFILYFLVAKASLIIVLSVTKIQHCYLATKIMQNSHLALFVKSQCIIWKWGSRKVKWARK